MADLRDSNPHDVFFVGADFRWAKLQGAHPGAANLYETRLAEEELAEATSLQGALMPAASSTVGSTLTCWALGGESG
jgi:uncharacterized protein YjbI with pentapeptide repeats